MQLRKSLVFLILLFSYYLPAQEAGGQTIALKTGQVDFPVDIQKGSSEGVVMGWNLMAVSDASAYRKSSELSDYRVFAMPLSNLFSYNYCYLPDRYLQKRFDVLLARWDYSGEFRIWIDENANNDFTDEVGLPIHPDKPLLLKVHLLLDSIGKKISLPLQVNLQGRGKNISLQVINLLKYQLKYSLPDTQIQLYLLVNHYSANFKLNSNDLSNSRNQAKVFLLEEPFLFAGRFFVIRNLDILNNTIELVELPSASKPYGYKIGYYADVNRIVELTGKSQALADCEPENPNKEYLLLHFWMHSAQPCIDQFGELPHLEEMINKSGKAQMINFPALISRFRQKQETAVLKEKIFTYSLPCMQFLELADKGSCGLPYNRRNTVSEMFDVNTYPTYILLNNKGEILYRGGNRHHELHALLKELGLWKE